MEKQNFNEKIYVGLDIGTDSVGYAVTDSNYRLKKFKGESMWGVHTFDPALGSQERRAFRTARRRLDRRQMRIKLLEELFATEIAKVDDRFFIRIKESSLWRDDVNVKDRHIFFNEDGYNDSHYFKQYPTVHHLIYELMNSEDSHDIRLVYLACAWLVAHRGHFLKEISKENLNIGAGFADAYEEFLELFDECGADRPWRQTDPQDILSIINMHSGITAKTKAMAELLFDGKVPKDKSSLDSVSDIKIPYSRAALIKLLCGGKISSPTDLFLENTECPEDLKSITLDCSDEDFADKLNALGEDGEILSRLRNMRDTAALIELMGEGNDCISLAKIRQYDKHKKDLKLLKRIIKSYLPEKYDEVFKHANDKVANYVAYSGNFRSLKEKHGVKGVSAKEFCEYLGKLLKNLSVSPSDAADYNAIMRDIENASFMPKQKNGDNRIIPYQLYWYELKTLLSKAEKYLPFLTAKSEGLTVSEKILSIFEFRVPYFVGPLHGVKGQKSYWIERKAAGRITPWNIEEKIDFDKTEEAFIKKLTGTCTYLPGEDVLPKDSLIYTKYCVLNEINNIAIDGVKISVELKQKIFEDLFKQYGKVSIKQLRKYLESNFGISSKTIISGIDGSIKSNVSSTKDFRRCLENGLLTEKDVENIISHSACSENKERFKRWLKKEYRQLSDDDLRYISSKSYKDFGRLSEKFLTGVYGTVRDGDGEAFTILEALWNTNDNLMQILSSKYTFCDTVDELNKSYYSCEMTLDDRLNSMYISGAVKRPIIRALDIMSDIKKVTGRAPDKIFIEMARGGEESAKGKRTLSRKETLIKLFDQVKTDDAKRLKQELIGMGEKADGKLQSEKLYLYYLQLGRSMYSGKPIDLNDLFSDKVYDVDHIYPQHFVKDDSIINNKVLVLSTENSEKGDKYPLDAKIRANMTPFWEMLHDAGLVSDEKFKRLVRKQGFTDEERWNFINRQLVETRQSTKAVATLLKEKYPETEIVYVKAGLVSEFRHEYGMHKSRLLNDLHHAKDAYLNIVVGNVYDAKFNKRWFKLTDNYSMKIDKLFKYPVINIHGTAWEGEKSIGVIKKYYSNNHAHVTRYAFCRKGGLFDQMPNDSTLGAVPRKLGLPVEKYGGYSKTKASFFVLVKYKAAKKNGAIIMPVELMFADKFLNNAEFKHEYAKRIVGEFINANVESVDFPLGKRIIKINTVLECDGIRLCVVSKSGGSRLGLLNITPFICSDSTAEYIRQIEKLTEKYAAKPDYTYDPEYGALSAEGNIALYDYYISKLQSHPFVYRPSNPVESLMKHRDDFTKLCFKNQVICLKNIHTVFIKVAAAVDLELLGESKTSAINRFSLNLVNLKKAYKSIKIVDTSASGFYEEKSSNLLELL